jgi:uncharacterized protein
MDSNSASSLTYLLRRIVAALVDDERDISIGASTEGDHVTLRVEVNPDDTGKVIGKKGLTARSIRTLMSAAAMKEKCHVSIDIVNVTHDI